MNSEQIVMLVRVYAVKFSNQSAAKCFPCGRIEESMSCKFSDDLLDESNHGASYSGGPDFETPGSNFL
jgi:hypothetical protein